VLVLQGAVQDGPPQLVPAVGADVALGVELGEQELIRAALDPQPQRRRAGGGLQPDRLDLGHGQPELVAHGLADRLPSPARHIDVRGAAAPVGDREHLVRGEVPERGDRDRHGERDAEQHIAGVIDTQVQAGQTEHGDYRDHRRLGVGAGAARHGQAVDGAHQEDREDRHRGGHPGVPAPAADDRHAVRAWPGQPEVDRCPGKLQEQHAAQEHQQVPPAPERHRQGDHRQAERGGPPAGARPVDPVGHIGQPRRPYSGQETQHPRACPVIDPEPRRVLGRQEGAGETTAPRISHAVVLMVIGCGSGGGAPVGRRLRRVLWTAGPGGKLAGPFPAATGPMSSLNVRHPPPGSAHVRAASCRPPL
jgi:hypothetical protein